MAQKIKVNNDIIQDAVNFARGVYAPLRGFLRERDYNSVLGDMRLSDGRVWSMPIVLDIDKETAKKLKPGEGLILTDSASKERARLDNIEIYDFDKKDLALKVYGTADFKHPGAAAAMNMGDDLVGGEIASIVRKKRGKFFQIAVGIALSAFRQEMFRIKGMSFCKNTR